MSSDRCACDACGAPDGPLDDEARCGFCATHCFPLGAFGERTVRLAMTAESRRAIHARAAGPAPDVDPRLVARQLQRQVVDAALDAAAPMAEQALGAALRFVRRKLGGRR